MVNRRPRVALSITPRLLQDTLTVALSQHAEVVDLMEWRDAHRSGCDSADVFDVAVVSGGVLPGAVAANLVIDINGQDGVPSLDSLQARLQAITVAE